MKNYLLFTAIIIALLCHFTGHAQEPTRKNIEIKNDTVDRKKSEWNLKIKEEIKELEELKKEYESKVREEMMEDIKKINARAISDDAYTDNMATVDKKRIAEVYAERIKKHNEMVDSQIAFAMVKTYSDAKAARVGFVWKDGGGFTFNFGSDDVDEQVKKHVRTTRTGSIALGYNYMTGDNLGIDDFSYPNNNYFSFGILWQTALNKSQTLACQLWSCISIPRNRIKWRPHFLTQYR